MPPRFALSLPLFVLVVVVVVSACPGEKRRAASRGDTLATAVRTDTAAPPGDISGVKSAVPSAAPDTFRARKLPSGAADAAADYPPPPAPLLAAVQREQAVSRFCYQEFGQKSDPTLTGGVAIQVTVGSAGITGARVASQNWSSAAGRAVDRCLSERAARAWKLEPGAVPPGKYFVPLAFRGS